MKRRLAPGSQFGKWRLLEFIARGGNGEVWRVAHDDARQGAIKFLRANYVVDGPRYERFKSEIDAMRKCADIPGVLPLWDYYIPDRPAANDPPWLVSPLAVPLNEQIAQIASLEAAVKLCHDLAETVAAMHERGVSHRDIKPENIFLYNERWCLGDLGLADFPEKSAITADGERLGPMYYIAPEMLNHSTRSDGAPADVYSLSKLLWKLATGQKYPIPGFHSRAEPAHTVSAYSKDPRAHSIDALIEAGTQTAPEKRPPMNEMARSLSTWLQPPILHASSPSDLSHLRQRIDLATRPSREAAKRLTDIQRSADEERGRVFQRFQPTLKQVAAVLDRAGCERIQIQGPSGGNALFYRSVTGDEAAGTSLEVPTTWFFEYSVEAILTNDSVAASLRAGVNLGIANVRDHIGPLHDITAPVRAAAGFVVQSTAQVRRAETQIRFKAGDSGTFYFGQPTEDSVVDRLINALNKDLEVATEHFVRALEEVP